MKHRFKNGKWMPENGTFVHVPNEQITEVIQLLRDNGQPVSLMQSKGIRSNHSGIFFDGTANELGGWVSSMTFFDPELPFPDFKALVTGKLPESFCIQCTREAQQHESWNELSYILPRDWLARPGYYIGFDGVQPWSTNEPFGEVLQIETWAALNDLMPQKCKGCNGAGELSKPPFDDSEECPFCKGSGLDEIKPPHWDDPIEILRKGKTYESKLSDDELVSAMINELKSRGYLGTKEICIETDIQVTANRLDNGEPVTGYFVSRTGRFGACPCIIVPTHDLEEPDKEYRIDYTTARLNSVEDLHEKPCTCKPVPADAFPDEPLIRVLKSRGYTVSKIY